MFSFLLRSSLEFILKIFLMKQNIKLINERIGKQTNNLYMFGGETSDEHESSSFISCERRVERVPSGKVLVTCAEQLPHTLFILSALFGL